MATLDKVKEFFGFKEHHEEQVFSQPIIKNESNDESKKNVAKPSFKASFLSSSSAMKSLFEIKVEEPRVYEDSLHIASLLREGKPVVVSLKYLDKDSSKRLVDFLCGTTFAINGHMMKVGDNIFLFAPSSVSIAHGNEKEMEASTEQSQEGINSSNRKVSGL